MFLDIISMILIHNVYKYNMYKYTLCNPDVSIYTINNTVIAAKVLFMSISSMYITYINS